jgi:hypothetical protein
MLVARSGQTIASWAESSTRISTSSTKRPARGGLEGSGEEEAGDQTARKPTLIRLWPSHWLLKDQLKGFFDCY